MKHQSDAGVVKVIALMTKHVDDLKIAGELPVQAGADHGGTPEDTAQLYPPRASPWWHEDNL